ncbi:MAG: hypothetical protein NTV77_00240 [Candidatus Azambacteria bacterium]|nr:hypothetical protein [Candidatus Azambacteria bacterium]
MNISKTWIWIIIVIVALVLIGWAAWYYGFFSPVATEEGAQQPVSDRDTTADISNDLNSVDLGNPDQDLKNLDSDLNQL